MKSKNPEWIFLEKVKKRVFSRLRDSRSIHQINFLPHMNKKLEIYVFLNRDEDLIAGEKSGFIQLVKDLFNEELRLGEAGRFENVRFEFDSYENVVKNFRGNYFFRLR